VKPSREIWREEPLLFCHTFSCNLQHTTWVHKTLLFQPNHLRRYIAPEMIGYLTLESGWLHIGKEHIKLASNWI
jgi:hypothetical protein